MKSWNKKKLSSVLYALKKISWKILAVYIAKKVKQMNMHKTISSIAIEGLNAIQVNVEIDINKASEKFSFSIVGFVGTPITKSKQRITTAIKNSYYSIPAKGIVVNLSPADIKKEGTFFDLPIAIGILCAHEIINISDEILKETIIVGELSLDGTINPIKGALAIASDLSVLNKKRLIVPKKNEHEAALVSGIEVIGVRNLREAIDYLSQEKSIKPAKTNVNDYLKYKKNEQIDFDDVKGQEYAKRALQIAAAGRHNFLFSGPPGSGKSMLAKRISTIMPDMTFEEIIETTKIYSIAGKLGSSPLVIDRPFRSPHHTSTRQSLIGGGHNPYPGEISMSHNGILFLDELTEFPKETLESLREPLENRYVDISRLSGHVRYPCSFLLIGAYNPCPCGFFGDLNKKCICAPKSIKAYQNRLSGPLLDRMDIIIGVRAIEYEDAIAKKIETNMSSHKLKLGVMNAVKNQEKRFLTKNKSNSMMSSTEIEKYCKLTDEAQETLKKAFEKLKLSMRAYHKIIKVAQTIADIDDNDIINKSHIIEALMYKFEPS